MPGLMTTFVNVGLNDELAEALARKPGLRVGGLGLLPALPAVVGHVRRHRPRLLRRHHDRVQGPLRRRAQKLDFTAGAHARDRLRLQGARPRAGRGRSSTTPSRQVVACIRKVLDSWDSPQARLYRQYIGVAEEWGTAVVVQRMVFGNLSRESGSGVTFTHNPLEPHSRQVRLFGDFAVRSQGEDLVGGLVFPLAHLRGPAARQPHLPRDSSTRWSGTIPRSTRPLLAVARDLVGEREYDPQEIEFTFESPAGDGPLRPAEAGRGAGADQATPPTSTPRRPTTARRSPWAWAWPAAPTRAAWPSTPSRSTGCWPRRRTRTSCCCARTRCPRTSP